MLLIIWFTRLKRGLPFITYLQFSIWFYIWSLELQLEQHMWSHSAHSRGMMRNARVSHIHRNLHFSHTLCFWLCSHHSQFQDSQNKLSWQLGQVMHICNSQKPTLKRVMPQAHVCMWNWEKRQPRLLSPLEAVTVQQTAWNIATQSEMYKRDVAFFVFQSCISRDRPWKSDESKRSKSWVCII